MENVANPGLIGILFVLLGVLGIVPFFRLSQIFEYPDILRQPTGDILRKYHDGGSGLTVTWCLFALFAAPLFALAPLLQDGFVANGIDMTFATIATVIAIIGAVFNIIGLIRWVFVVPLLVRKYVDPDTGQTVREAIEVVFEAFHTYLGVTVGEFLGFSFLGLWGIMVGLAIIQTEIVSSIFGYAAVLFSVGVLVGDLEFAGWKPAGLVVAISSSLFMLWAIVVGVVFIIG